MEYVITAEKRIVSGTDASKKIRKSGKIPGIVYGFGKENVMITIDRKDFEKVWQQAGESSLVRMNGLGDEIAVLIKDVTLDPYYDVPSHADFYAVEKDVAVEVEVPLIFSGISPAEKSLGGTLIKVLHGITVEALPKDLPAEIFVDISTLETFEDHILVKDITLPSGVTAVIDSNEVVALVQGAREEDSARAEVDLASIEVAKKGKEDVAA